MMKKIVLNKKYKELVKTNDRYIIVTGGRGSSKSFSISTYLLMLMMAESGHTILFTRLTMTSAHLSIIPEFLEKIQLFGVEDLFNITKDAIECKATGSNIIFRGLRTSQGDQTANLKSLNGVTIWCCDEAEELISEDMFEKINLSVRSKIRPNKIILILNPSTKEHFIYNRFFIENGVNGGWNGSKDNVTYIHTTYLDNIKNLSESYVADLEKIKLTNPKKFDHLILGGWLDKAEGVIFSNWSIGKFDDTIEYGYGVDFGFSNDPSTLTKVAVDKKNKIIYLDEKVYQTKLTTSDLEILFKGETGNKLIIADNSEPRLIEELKKTGLNIKPCVKGAGSVGEGLKLMEDYKIIITSTSTNIIKEFNNYVWNDKKSGTPIDMYNHSIDGIRYYVSNSLKAATGVYHVY